MREYKLIFQCSFDQFSQWKSRFVSSMSTKQFKEKENELGIKCIMIWHDEFCFSVFDTIICIVSAEFFFQNRFVGADTTSLILMCSHCFDVVLQIPTAPIKQFLRGPSKSCSSSLLFCSTGSSIVISERGFNVLKKTGLTSKLSSYFEEGTDATRNLPLILFECV